MSGKLTRALASGCVFGVLGLCCGLGVALLATGDGWSWLPLAAGLGAFVPGLGISWLLLGRASPPSLEARILSGALVGLVSHPIAWYLMILTNWIRGQASSLGGAPLDPLQGISGALILSTMSLLLVGWVTIPLAAVIGATMVRGADERLSPSVGASQEVPQA